MGEVEVLVLGAGFSRRMGTNKLLLPLVTETVIESTIAAFLAAKVSGITVVLGNEKEKLRTILGNYPVDIVDNVCYPEGMGASIRAGIEKIAGQRECAAVLVMPGDMPFVKPATIDCIIEAYRDSQGSIVVPVYQGEKGHPVLFDRSFFPDLCRLSGDIGARKVVGRYAGHVHFVSVDDPGIHIDLDSPAEYELMARSPRRNG